jgi:hypothetical protein
MQFLLCLLLIFLVTVSGGHWTSWDPEPLEPYFWLPSTLFGPYDISHRNEEPCSRVKSAITLGTSYGRLNNYLITLTHMLEIAAFSNPPKALFLSPLYDKFIHNDLNVINATRKFACVMRWNSPEAKKYPLETKLVAEMVYTQKQQKYNTFRGQLLANFFLSPAQHIRTEVEAIEAQFNLTGGFNAIHFRGMEGSCIGRTKWIFEHQGFPYAKELGRYINEKDVCDMTFDYVQWKLKSQGTEELPLFISHDNQNIPRLTEMLAECRAVRTTCVAHTHENPIVDILLLIRANTFVPTVPSSMSGNLEEIRKFIHLPDEFIPDVVNVPDSNELIAKYTPSIHLLEYIIKKDKDKSKGKDEDEKEKQRVKRLRH